jgi:hypothetical protein
MKEMEEIFCVGTHKLLNTQTMLLYPAVVLKKNTFLFSFVGTLKGKLKIINESTNNNFYVPFFTFLH